MAFKATAPKNYQQESLNLHEPDEKRHHFLKYHLSSGRATRAPFRGMECIGTSPMLPLQYASRISPVRTDTGSASRRWYRSHRSRQKISGIDCIVILVRFAPPVTMQPFHCRLFARKTYESHNFASRNCKIRNFFNAWWHVRATASNEQHY